MTMRTMGIVADDLTGASDSGVQLARIGWSPLVVMDGGGLDAALQAEEKAVVIDTDSRSASPEEAYGRVREAGERLIAAGYPHIYKKLDSTLRGNIGRELDALLDADAFDYAVVAPAYPRNGRTTVNGIHYVRGVPLHRTEAARDPKRPVRDSEIARILAGQSARKSGLLPLAALRAGDSAVREALRRMKREQVRLVVCDAESEDDLARIAAVAGSSGDRVLWAGSAGLAEHLPRALGFAGRGGESGGGAGGGRSDSGDGGGSTGSESDAGGGPSAPLPIRRPVLLTAGSLSGVTREQAAAFGALPAVACVRMDPLPAASDSPAARAAEADRCRRLLLDALARGRDACLCVAPDAPPSAANGHAAVSGEPERRGALAAARIADALGEITAAAVAAGAVGGLILTGGDTARSACRRLGASHFRLIMEVEPGVPLGLLNGPHPLPVVTKAGAFGNRETLVHALHTLKGAERP